MPSLALRVLLLSLAAVTSALSMGAAPPPLAPAAAQVPESANWIHWWRLNRSLYTQRGQAVYGAGPGVRGTAPETDFLREELVPVLLTVLEREKDKDMLIAALMTLGKLGLDAPETPRGLALTSQEAIVSMLDHGNQEVAESAVIALGILGRSSVAQPLVEILKGEYESKTRKPASRRLRALAAYGLGVVGRRSTAEAVRSYCVHHLVDAIEQMDGVSSDVGVACVISLGMVRLKPSEAVADPEAAPPTPSASRQGQVRYLLGLLSEHELKDEVLASVPVALARLAADQEGLREGVAQDFVTRLALRSKEATEVRLGCVQGLGLLGNSDQAPMDAAIRSRLLEVVRDGERLERVVGLVALGRVGGRRGSGPQGEGATTVRSYLMGRLESGESMQKPWAALGLGLLERGRAAQGAPPALGTLNSMRKLIEKSRNPDTAAALYLALGLAGDQEAKELLLKRMGGDEVAGGAAMTALGMLGAQEARNQLWSVAHDATRPLLAHEGAVALALLRDRTIQSALYAEATKARFLVYQVSTIYSLAYVGDGLAIPTLYAILTGRRQSENARAAAIAAIGIIADKDLVPWNHAMGWDANWWKAPATLIDTVDRRGILDVF
ncbi:MAG: HEAT repeat protein [Planctomycetota bacterium]|jgi:HEAT repeat protein